MNMIFLVTFVGKDLKYLSNLQESFEEDYAGKLGWANKAMTYHLIHSHLLPI